MASMEQFFIQLIGVDIVGLFSVICTFILWIPMKTTIGLRADKEEKLKGLGFAEHEIDAYADFKMSHHKNMKYYKTFIMKLLKSILFSTLLFAKKLKLLLLQRRRLKVNNQHLALLNLLQKQSISLS